MIGFVRGSATAVATEISSAKPSGLDLRTCTSGSMNRSVGNGPLVALPPPIDDGDSELRPLGLGEWLALAPPNAAQSVLETSFPIAFRRLDIRDGDLGVSLPRYQAKQRAVGWVLRNEAFLTRQRIEEAMVDYPPRMVIIRELSFNFRERQVR